MTDTDLTARQQEALTLLDRAKAIAITTPEQYVTACEFFKAIKSSKKKFIDWFEPMREAAYNAYQSVLSKKKEVADRYDEAEAVIAPKLTAWDEEQRRKERELQVKLQEEARKRLEEEQLNDAALAESLGEPKLAEQILQAPTRQVVVEPPRMTPKVPGISYRESWSGEVIDIKAVVKFALENPAYGSILAVNQSALDRIVHDAKGKISIPGVAVKYEKKPVGRTR